MRPFSKIRDGAEAMTSVKKGYQRILVATDFSMHANAALKQAVWLARQTGAKLVVAHAIPDLYRAVTSGSYWAKLDQLYGEGEQFEDFERNVRRESETKLQRLIVNLNAVDLDVNVETLLGDPFVTITHAVQHGRYDLVLAGTRGLAAWEQFLIGDTAKRLIRKCPASGWIVKAEYVGPPKAILAATDFSDVSRQAVLEGHWIADQASAEFHLLHVVDSKDIPEETISQIPEGSSLRREIDEAAKQRLDDFVKSLNVEPSRVHRHLSWGIPWKEVGHLAQHLSIDLIAMGTVGRSGIKGLLLGNTAEKVLGTCDCNILTVKPADFISPIMPPFEPLHPGPENKVS
ncbi:MAG: universal stress protein [Lysobacterales bacterium]|nr:MAG: universal stress protein [Xanthomonadales bacterium]